MPMWLNLLLTMPSYILLLSLGLLILNLKIRFNHLILIAIVTSIINVSLEQWFSNPLIKILIPIFVMIKLYAYLSKISILKSSIAVIMGLNIYYFIESITLLISYNLLKIYPEVYSQSSIFHILGILFVLSFGLGIIVLIKTFGWKLYNLTKIAENSRQNESILTTALLFTGVPLLIYCFIVWLTVYTESLTASNISLILNIANVIFLIYFFAICFALRSTEYALQKIFRDKADNSVIALLQQFLETQLQVKEDLSSKINNITVLLKQQRYTAIPATLYAIKDYVKPKTPVDLIPIPQLRLFFQTECALAQEREVDFIFHIPDDWSGLEAYVDDAFIRMLKNLYENAFEAVEAAEFKEIYSEIAKDDDGGFTLIIKNNGVILPSGHQSQQFELGYTTKNAPDRGYGLFRVKKLIDYYQGSIDLRGSDGYTQVIIKLPFKENYTSIQQEKSERPVLRLIKNNEI